MPLMWRAAAAMLHGRLNMERERLNCLEDEGNGAGGAIYAAAHSSTEVIKI